MAGLLWFQKIGNPDEVINAATAPVNDETLRFTNATHMSGAWKDEPEVVQAFMNTNVPYALANRAYAEYSAKKAVQMQQSYTDAGYSKSQLNPSLSGAAQDGQSRQQTDKTNSQIGNTIAPNAGQPSYSGTSFGSDLAQDPGKALYGLTVSGQTPQSGGAAGQGISNWLSGAVRNVANFGENIFGKVSDLASKVSSPLTAPLAAGSAQGETPAQAMLSAIQVNNTHMLGGLAAPLTNPMLAIGRSAIDYVKGLGTIFQGDDLAQSQKNDMRLAGYDPDSITSRYSYYYKNNNDKRSPVAETDINRLKQEYDPHAVDLARELTVTGFANDPINGMAGLSSEAQQFARTMMTQGADPKNAEMYQKMQDGSSLSFGGHLLVPGSNGVTQGTASRQIGSALADLVAFWYVDPAIAGPRAYKAARYAMNGIPANSIERVSQMVAASDEDFNAVGGPAKRMDNAMRTVDQIYNLHNEGQIAEAATMAESFRRLHPDMSNIYDTLMATRSGAVRELSIPEKEAQLKEAQAAVNSYRQPSPYFYKVAETDGQKPIWSITNSAAEEATNEASAKARATMADMMSMVVYQDALASGRPLYKGQLMMPGQIAVNRRFRQAIAPVRDWLGNQDQKLMDMMDAARGKMVPLDGELKTGSRDISAITAQATPPSVIGTAAVAEGASPIDALTSDAAAEWVHDTYSQQHGLGSTFTRVWRNFEDSFSGKTLQFNTPEGSEIFRRFVTQFFPRRMSYALATEFAQRDEAARMALFRQVGTSAMDAAGVRDTPQAQKFMAQFTKSFIPEDADANAKLVGPYEQYGVPSVNTIQVGDHEMAAALYPHQLSDGVVLPSLKEFRQLSDKSSLLGWVTGLANSSTGDMLNKLWKASKTVNPALAMRFVAEQIGYNGLMNPEALAKAATSRFALKAAAGSVKYDENQIARMANSLRDVVTPEEIGQIEQARKIGDVDKWSSVVGSTLAAHGIDQGSAEMLKQLSSTVDLANFGTGTRWNKMTLALAGPLDYVRRVRAESAKRLGIDTINESPMARYLDGEVADKFTQAASRELGVSTDYAQLGAAGANQMRNDMGDAISKGFKPYPVKIPNAYGWLDDKSDFTAHQWATEIGKRQSDPLPDAVMRHIAASSLNGTKDYLPGAGGGLTRMTMTSDASSPAAQTAIRKSLADLELKRVAASNPELKAALRTVADDGAPAADKASAAQLLASQRNELLAAGGGRLTDDAISSPQALAQYLVTKDELGADMRSRAVRLKYTPSGQFADTPEKVTEAATKYSSDMVEDLVHHMGGTIEHDGSIQFPAGMTPILERIARGEPVSAQVLAPLGDDLKPSGLVTQLWLPDLGRGPDKYQRLTDLASKAYNTVVAKPTLALANHPVFMANRRIAYDQMMPVLDELTNRGMTESQAAYFLEAAANRHALAATFAGTDHPANHSVFSEMTDNFLSFERAKEDFMRRFLKASAADPSVLGKAQLMLETASHAGMVRQEKVTTDEGNEEYRNVFTYPGSALGQRLLLDASAAFGFTSKDALALPSFNGFSGEVRHLNAALAAPVDFAVNPIFAAPLKMVETFWPSQTMNVDRIYTLLNGGKSSFAEQSIFQDMLPNALTRWVPLMTQNDQNGQLASAQLTAMKYAAAAGILPDPDKATPGQIQKAQDAVKSLAINILTQRAIFGALAPASPRLEDPVNIQQDAVSRVAGLQNINSEWFDVLAQEAKKYPQDNAIALSNAYVEWAKRYPEGKLIANPSAFTTGVSEMRGSQTAEPTSIPATQWMLDNLDFIKNNRGIAFNLMPQSAKAGAEWYNGEGYRLQTKLGLRDHKELTDFYNDVTTAQAITDWHNSYQSSQAAQMMNPDQSKQIKSQFAAWEADWKRLNPVASKEMDERQDPQWIKTNVVPSLAAIATGQTSLPADLQQLQPDISRMYNDYNTYEQKMASNKSPLSSVKSGINSQWRTQGDQRWSTGPLASLWSSLKMYEN